MSTSFIVPRDWSPETDEVYRRSTPVPPLKAFAWWFRQGLFYFRRYAVRLIQGSRYRQEDSIRNYEDVDTNLAEEKLIQEDKFRVLVADGRLAEGFDSSAKKVRLKYLYEELRDTPGVKTILDFGCGLGLNTISVSKAFPELDVRGFDVSPQRIEFARKMCGRFGMDPGKLAVDDGTNLKLPSQSVDVVYTSLVLEQLPTLADKALREMARVAKKKIVLMEPAYEEGNPSQKLYIRSQDYVRGLVKKAKSIRGWTVRSVTPFSTYSNPLCPTAMIVLVPEAN